MKLARTRTARAPRVRSLAACMAAAFGVASGHVIAVEQPTAAGGSSNSASAPASPREAAIASAAATNRHLRGADSLWHPAPHRLPDVPASSIPVTNCDDSGSGSLRQALQDAASGDTIDLTATGCSRITLTTGSILFMQTDITLQGPGYGYLAISGNSQYAPLLHDGTGTLSVNDLTIEAGRKYFTNAQTTNARGGCIFSYGTVSLDASEVKYCTVESASNYLDAEGGAIYAQNSVVLNNSYIFDNTAINTVRGAGGGIFSRYISVTDSKISGNTATASAGGIWASNSLYVKYSTIANNNAYLHGYPQGGGGIHAVGPVHIENSTISGNRSDTAGGISVLNASTVVLLNSTISGNSAIVEGGGMVLMGVDNTLIANCTIAFNSEGNDRTGAGLWFPQNGSVDIESSIVADNAHVGDYDIAGFFSGSHNIIGSSLFAPPPDTITADPELQPLASNGGLTQTHALRDTSPAIDAGNNVQNATYDQRGTGFPRVIGPQPDIGAYEFDPSPLGFIFASGFD
jgi:hypothetical protein